MEKKPLEFVAFARHHLNRGPMVWGTENKKRPQAKQHGDVLPWFLGGEQQ